MSGLVIGRRRALGLLAAGMASVATGMTGWVAGLGAPESRFQPAVTGRPVAEPAVLASRDGVLDVSLKAASGASLAGRPTSVLGFNGTSPGRHCGCVQETCCVSGWLMV